MIAVELAQDIDAPAERCRRHFFDMRHHEQHRVHAGATFHVREADAQRVLYEQRTRFFGAMLVDVAELRRCDDAAKTLENRVLSGASAGLVVHFRFEALDAARTRVHLRATWAPTGLKRLLTPLLRSALVSGFARAVDEDRADLEGGRYPG